MYIIAIVLVVIYFLVQLRTVKYYYRPGCPHCHKFEPVWSEFAKRTTVKVVKINCSEEVNIEVVKKEHEKGMTGVPHVVSEGILGSRRKVFTGPRTLEGLMEFSKSL